MTIENFMMLLCGLGLFLYGMKLMGDGLELAAGSRLKTMIERLTTNKYMGALIGLQSQRSSRALLLLQSWLWLRKCRIDDFGAGRRRDHGRNIGTTVTGFMIALSSTASHQLRFSWALS